MFNDDFENLWENGIRLNEVCKEYKGEFSWCFDPNFIKWCEGVSPIKENRKIETKR